MATAGAEAVLDMFLFQSLSEVAEQTEQWLKEFNEERHMTLWPPDAQEIFVNQKTGNL